MRIDTFLRKLEYKPVSRIMKCVHPNVCSLCLIWLARIASLVQFIPPIRATPLGRNLIRCQDPTAFWCHLEQTFLYFAIDAKSSLTVGGCGVYFKSAALNANNPLKSIKQCSYYRKDDSATPQGCGCRDLCALQEARS